MQPGPILALLLAALGLPGAGFAQIEPPRVPAAEPLAVEAPRRLIPPQPETVPVPEDIEVETLDVPVIGPEAPQGPTGLEPETWHPASPGLILRLLQNLPRPITDPAARELALALLASLIPASDAGGAVQTAGLKALAALGTGTGTEGADCSAVALVARLACFADRDDAAGFELQLTLARERGTEIDPAVMALAEAWLAGQTINDPVALAATPPDAAPLVAALDISPSAVDLETVPPSLAGFLAANGALGENLRLGLAERAAAGGALPVERLEAFYADVGPGAEGLPRNRAQALEALRAAQAPEERLTALLDAWALVEPGTFRPVWARLLAPHLAGLAPDPEGIDRLLVLPLAAGEAGRARALRAPLGPLPLGDEAPILLLTLAGDRTALPMALTRLEQDPDPFFLALLAGLGLPLPDSLLAAAPDQGKGPGLAPWLDLRTARAGGAAGPVALAALILLGQRPHEAPPLAVAMALDALQAAGFEEEARAIALSLAAARGA